MYDGGRIALSKIQVVWAIFLVLVTSFSGPTAFGQSSAKPKSDSSQTNKDSASQSDQAQEDKDPIERSDDLKSKVTSGIYFTPGARVYDLNLRHQFGSITAWIAGFHDPKSSNLLRVGAQYDYRKKWFHFVPTVEIATTKAVAGFANLELGGKTYFIAGMSRTNLKPFEDLFWDPSESLQFGIGHKISSYDRISAFTIFDIRLHTSQQNTHVVWRHKINANNGITLDGVFKSGHTDSGEFIRDVGIGVYYDRPRWFWKLYYDPHVNFADRTMVRTGIGLKF